MRGNITRMTDDTDAVRADLAKTGRAYVRAKKVINEDLPAVVRRAHAAGLTFAEIARAAEHAITPERVRQILKPKRPE
jgi:hypothetical protein